MNSSSPAFSAFPSLYVAEAFSLVFSLLGNVLFPLSYIFAMLVSLFQLPAGANPWLDIGVGMAIAGLGYDISESIVFRQKKQSTDLTKEREKRLMFYRTYRRVWPILILGPQKTSYLVLLALFVGIPVMHLTVMGIKVSGIEDGSRKQAGLERHLARVRSTMHLAFSLLSGCLEVTRLLRLPDSHVRTWGWICNIYRHNLWKT